MEQLYRVISAAVALLAAADAVCALEPRDRDDNAGTAFSDLENVATVLRLALEQ